MHSNKVFDLGRLIALRQHFHKFPEIGLEEFQTQQTIKEYLLSIGVQESCIKACAKTGLVVDLTGRAAALPGPHKTVAFRADMDGLLMAENNPELPYKSVTKVAHMCGHDGHMTCLLGGLTLLKEVQERLPSNRTARFLFQPGEEGVGGALLMVKDNCLEGVNEVWGMHNMPWDPVGRIFVKPGPMMASICVVRLTVEGKGGHSSLKETLKNPVLPICEINAELEKLLETEFAEWNNKQIVFSMPLIQASTAPNVFPDKAVCSGTLRGFDREVTARFLEALEKVVDVIAKKRGVKITIEKPFSAPLVSNDSDLAGEITRLFGDRVGSEQLPVRASEDFCEFADRVPGCFFFYGIGRQAGPSLHVDCYNFNDDVIEDASNVWLKLIKNRLNFE